MTLKTLLYNIAEYAIGNKIINYSAAGPSLYGLNMETIKDYPVLFASPTGNHNITPNLTTYTITLYYIDRLTRGGDNDIDILSTSVEGLKSIINGIKYLPGVIEVYDDYNITNFADTQKMSDNVAGAYATITIRTANNSTCPDGGIISNDNIVNVYPKFSLKDTGLKIGYSTFKEIPEWLDFDGVTDMSNMFYNCGSLQTIPLIDTSNVTNMARMFSHCVSLQKIPLIDTSNVTDMDSMFLNCSSLQTIPLIDTSNVTDMGSMFQSCGSLQTIPLIDTSNVTDMRNMFFGSNKLISIPPLNANKVIFNNFQGLFYSTTMNNLTDFGGLIGLKNNSNNDYTFVRCPNLTYQSCINILNGLYDFVGNNEQPTSSQGKLKVHPNFLDLVGDEISIGTDKGWTITA